MEKGVTSTTDRVALYRYLRTLNKYQYTTQDFGLSLLHLSLSTNTTTNDYRLKRICKCVFIIDNRKNASFIPDIHVCKQFAYYYSVVLM